MKSDLTAWPCHLIPLCHSLHISFALLAGCTHQLLLLKWHQIKTSLTLVPSVLLQPLHALTAFDTLNPKADTPDTNSQNTLSTDPNPKHAIQLHIHSILATTVFSPSKSLYFSFHDISSYSILATAIFSQSKSLSFSFYVISSSFMSWIQCQH